MAQALFSNPIIYADYSDPDAIRVGDDYFMTASSFCNAPGLPILHSKDLVHWRLANYALPAVPGGRYANPEHGCGVWAPSIRFHDGLFYIYFPMPDEGIFVVTARDPLGQWSQPHLVRAGAGWIDPCPFWDDDGRAYLVAGVAKSRIGYKSVLLMAELSADGMSLLGSERRVFDGNACAQPTIEGPKLYKRNGWYYIFAPAGGVKTGWQTVLRSRGIFGEYEHRIVMMQGGTSVNGPHQGAWIQTQTGQDWFLHFQDVYAAGRVVHLQPMRWQDDWPVIGKPVAGQDWGEPVSECAMPDVGQLPADYDAAQWRVPASDDCDGGALSLQWQWNANPQSGWHAMTGSGIRLNAVPVSPLRPLADYRNLLLQKWPAPQFTCVTVMDISTLAEGDMAGIVSLGTLYYGLAVSRSGDLLHVRQIRGGQDFDCERAFSEQSMEEFLLPFTIKSASCRIVRFFYAVECVGFSDREELDGTVRSAPRERVTLALGTDGTRWSYDFSVTDVAAGRWVGVKHGVFCAHDRSVHAEGQDAGHVILRSVEYRSGEERL